MDKVKTFKLNGNVMTRLDENIWSCNVTRFLRDHLKIDNLLDELEFRLNEVYFVLYEDELYMCKNYNFVDEDYFVEIGCCNKGLYKVEISNKEKFDLVFSEMYIYRNPKKRKDKNFSKIKNLFQLDNPYVIHEKIFNKIFINNFKQTKEKFVSNPNNKALKILRERFEDIPFMQNETIPNDIPVNLNVLKSQKANIWWIKSTNENFIHKFNIRFMDAHILNVKDNNLPILFIRKYPKSLYQQVEKRKEAEDDDFYFKKIKY